MTTLNLKSKIIEQILFIEDKSFLMAIETIVKEKAESAVFHLSDFQKSRIKQSLEQLRDGRFIDNEQLDKKVEQWLSEK